MACSVPVIASNSGGIPEVVVHEESGLLNQVGDTNQMTINALKILSNNDRLEKFKSNALNQAKKFDIKIILPRYENLYRECINYYLSN
jgi:glycosyltransferase involved in cell wall biosynthesis